MISDMTGNKGSNKPTPLLTKRPLFTYDILKQLLKLSVTTQLRDGQKYAKVVTRVHFFN